MIDYTLTTNFVEVTVLPIYIEEQSIPYENCYVWMYNVKIKNKSQSTIQLLSRHWQIIDYKGKINEIAGVGVIGEQPVIKSGEVFKYTSGTYLNAPSGIMQGFTEINAIQEVEFLSTIMDPEVASDKQSIVDVLCKDSHGNRYIAEMVRPESLRSYCLKGEEFLQKETERILKLIKPDVLPSESTHQCESGNRLVPSDADNEPPLEKEDAQS